MLTTVTWIINLCFRIWDYCDASVVPRNVIWIVGFHHCAEGYGDGVVMVPHMRTYIIGFLHHGEGYYGGAATCFVAMHPPCIVICI
jgi:hypothetical protein